MKKFEAWWNDTYKGKLGSPPIELAFKDIAKQAVEASLPDKNVIIEIIKLFADYDKSSNTITPIDNKDNSFTVWDADEAVAYIIKILTKNM